jgi:CHAT domain-containing protein
LRDHQHKPLTVADIAVLNVPGQLAFLSACDTAVAIRQFTNETVNLTRAFHLAGYQRVIGTLWPVADEAAVELCTGFYKRLTKNRADPPAPDLAARALHQPVRELRRRYPDAPTHWAAHTCTGA